MDQDIKEYIQEIADHFETTFESIENLFLTFGENYISEKIILLSNYYVEKKEEMSLEHQRKFFLKSIDEDWKSRKSL